MAKTTTTEPTRPKGVRDMKTACGFCRDGRHAFCPGAVDNGEWWKPGDAIWRCPCRETEDCGAIRCKDCLNSYSESVDPKTWRCYDRQACREETASRLAASPIGQFLAATPTRRSKKMSTETATKAPKEPTYCLVTGEQTKGGLFKPGMDARYVKERVADVMEHGQDADDVAARMERDGVSEKLVDKFDKSLAAARARAEKANSRTSDISTDDDAA